MVPYLPPNLSISAVKKLNVMVWRNTKVHISLTVIRHKKEINDIVVFLKHKYPQYKCSFSDQFDVFWVMIISNTINKWFRKFRFRYEFHLFPIKRFRFIHRPRDFSQKNTVFFLIDRYASLFSNPENKTWIFSNLLKKIPIYLSISQTNATLLEEIRYIMKFRLYKL